MVLNTPRDSIFEFEYDSHKVLLMKEEHNPNLDLGEAHHEHLVHMINSLTQAVKNLEEKVADMHGLMSEQRIEKEWYSTDELAKAMDRSPYTIRERWCNEKRIECEKDPDSGKWRIPGEEFRRLVKGGAIKPKR